MDVNQVMNALPSILAANLTAKQKFLSRTNVPFTHPQLQGVWEIVDLGDKHIIKQGDLRYELELFEDHFCPNIKPESALHLEYNKIKFQ